MKIAVLGTRGFPGVQGGVEKHCENLYIRLAEYGCDITVFTRRPYVNPDLHTFKDLTLVSIDCPKSKFFEAIIHTFKGVLKAKQIKPDILHLHAIGPSLFAPLAKLLGMKVVVTNHGPDYERKKWSFFAKKFLILCEWTGIVFADEIIAISNNIADDINRRFNREATVIPNGVEVPVLIDTQETLKKYDLLKKRYILAVGRFVQEKGFDYLINAFNPGEFEGWKLVIVGSADHEDKYSLELKSKASENTSVILTGFLTGKPLQELYTHAGLFVLPSYYEGLPIVLLEAMSYGLSCIVSDIPSNRNVEMNLNRFFKPGDITSLKVKIKEFINKPWTEEDRRNQIKMIMEKYSWSKIANETREIYKRVLK